MGVYEIITEITKNEENLKVEIRQTEGTLGGNLVYIKNTKTNKAYSFTLADGDEAAEQKEYAENRLTAFKDRMSQFYEIEDTEFWKQVKEIDSKQMTDRQIAMALSKARETLKIVVDTKALKKTIRSMINA